MPRLQRARWTVGPDDTVSGPPSFAAAPELVSPVHKPLDRLPLYDSAGSLDAGGNPHDDPESAAPLAKASSEKRPTSDRAKVDETVIERADHRWDRVPGSNNNFEDQ